MQNEGHRPKKPTKRNDQLFFSHWVDLQDLVLDQRRPNYGIADHSPRLDGQHPQGNAAWPDPEDAKCLSCLTRATSGMGQQASF